MALPSLLSAISIDPDSLALSFLQASVLLTFFVVVVLAARFSVTIISGLKQYRTPSALTTFAKFFYASFLKPHNGDGAISGQQAALESFYKAQVVSSLPNSSRP